MTTDTGGPAFPAFKEQSDGMALRDYFAAKAMQGLMRAACSRRRCKGMIWACSARPACPPLPTRVLRWSVPPTP